MYAPHTVTVYNLSTETDKTTFEEITVLHATVLKGVLLQACKAVNVNKSGLVGADAVTLYVPFSVSATDGETGHVKEYTAPQHYWSAEDRTGLWTLSVDGNGGTTYFVKGEYLIDNPDILLAQDDCYKVTKVDMLDYGSEDMRHWQVGGV